MSGKKWSNRKTFINRILLALVIGMGLIICVISTPSARVPTSSRFIDLKASVEFNGIEFVITNNDTFDWTNVKMELNDTFTLRIKKIQAGETYYLMAGQFAKKDGTRFNPFMTKLLRANIFCDTPEGRGSWFGWWK